MMPFLDFFTRRKDSAGTLGTPQDNDQREGIDAQTADEFMKGNILLFVDSSNVEYVKYSPEVMRCEVGFLPKGTGDSRAYHYWEVFPDDMRAFLTSPSKGEWLWDYFRVRGSAVAHKKPYKRIK